MERHIFKRDENSHRAPPIILILSGCIAPGGLSEGGPYEGMLFMSGGPPEPGGLTYCPPPGGPPDGGPPKFGGNGGMLALGGNGGAIEQGIH